MKKTTWHAALRFARETAYKTPFWPVSIQRPRLFWFSVVLLVLGVSLTVGLGDFIHAYHEEVNALSTVAIAIFTAILGIFTINLSNSTRIAAEAAKLNADAVVRVELPFLALRRAFLICAGQAVPIGSPLPPEFEATIAFTNWGRSNAEIIKGCIERSVTDKLPPTPDYKNVAPYAPGIAVGNRADIPLDVSCKIKLTPAEIAEIDTGQKKLWVFGFIGFKDFLGDPHESAFCLKWSPHPQNRPGGFVYADDTPPAYIRRT